MIKGIVADIQRASLHDGPALRTTVFLKGCPLKCRWCHNPECISFEPQVLSYPEKCIGCGMCKEGCYSGAKVICGKEMTSDDVLNEILLDKDYYSEGGGVTFSGGEPMAQKEFLNELIDKCRDCGVNCAIETSMMYYDEKIFKKLDLIMLDIKIWDEDIHKQYTGVGNRKILENIKRLDGLDIPIIIRTPVIPGVEQGIDKISSFAKNLKNCICYELLPYHPLGVSKQKAIGIEIEKFEIPSKEEMQNLKQYAFDKR